MKAMIVYDSVYGNTEKVAQAIASALGSPEEVKTVKVSEARPEEFTGLKLLVVGSPTQRFRPTAIVNDLLIKIPRTGLRGTKVAVFDTRLAQGEIDKTPVLAFFVKLFGMNAYAAKPIVVQLKKRGGELIGSPEGFYVLGMKGPLAEGELERAVNWARNTLAGALK
jgi:flavodoxin I